MVGYKTMAAPAEEKLENLMAIDFITIPLEVLKIETGSYHLLLEGMVNSQRCRVLIDTGASRSVLDRAFVDRHFGEPEIELSDQLTSGLGTNEMQSQLVRVRQFSLSEWRLANHQFAVVNLAHVNQSYEQLGQRPIRAILGGDLLRQYEALIDYGRSELRLKPVASQD